MAEQTFDPRFDRAFQRGYVPPVKPQAAQTAPLPADAIGEPAAGIGPQQVEEVETMAGVVTGWRGINPYVVVLWVVGVVFVLGGTALLFGSYVLLMTSYTTTTSSQAATAQALYVFGSVYGVPLITVGLATIAGLVFFSAWQSWRRQNGSVA